MTSSPYNHQADQVLSAQDERLLGWHDPSSGFLADREFDATSVWVTAQQDAKTQRAGRYVPASVAHPAKMLPAIAAHAVRHFTRPGEIVLDPCAGSARRSSRPSARDATLSEWSTSRSGRR